MGLTMSTFSVSIFLARGDSKTGEKKGRRKREESANLKDGDKVRLDSSIHINLCDWGYGK